MNIPSSKPWSRRQSIEQILSLVENDTDQQKTAQGRSWSHMSMQSDNVLTSMTQTYRQLISSRIFLARLSEFVALM